MRRGSAKEIQKIKCADLKIDSVKHQVNRNGVRIDLTPKEFQLLLLMARRSGEVLSRTVISEQVWDMNFDSDTNIVDVAIRRLRNKVDDPFRDKLIHTIRTDKSRLRHTEGSGLGLSIVKSIMDLGAGYRYKDFRIEVNVLNLFDSNDADITYYFPTRLGGEARGGVNDVLFHQGEPRNVRVQGSMRF